MKHKFLLLILLAFSILSYGQTGKNQALMINSNAIGSNGIRINWPQLNFTGRYEIYKRVSLSTEEWGTLPYATVAGNTNGFTDSIVKEGEAFEYTVAKVSSANVTESLGYIYAGNKLKEPMAFDGLILLIDSNFIIPVAAQIQQLVNNLKNEGYKVVVLYAGRKENVLNIKSRITSTYTGLNRKVKTLFIIGHVPVPYSGFFSSLGEAPPPDGHVEGSGNHTGAWPADVYYADMINTGWTDNNVTCTTGTQTRHHNLPDDGKFDQTKIPNYIDLELGRVDFFGMSSFNKSDTILTINYLNRNNNWRTGKTQVIERALIDDNFTSLNLSSTGYNNFSTLIKSDSIFNNRDYMVSQKNGSYLWSFGCGAGSYTSCNGIGNTTNFVNDSFKNIFTMLSGSYFGDWDIANNFLKAPLAQSSLASFWGGIPKWFVHHMGLGMNIGYGAKITQNNTNFYFNGGFNSSSNSVHIALMGDPTLKMRNIGTVNQVNAESKSNYVFLNWSSVQGNIDGYAIYRVDTVNNIYSKLNTNTVTDTFFVDNQNFNNGTFTYTVKAIKLETTPSGSYYNTGGAGFVKINHSTNSINNFSKNKLNLEIFPNPSNGIFNVKVYNNQSIESMVSITELSGKELMNFKIENNKTDFKIDLTNQNRGIYILNISNNEGVIVKKILLF
ncbi:MAG: T9SS type A sorting domain-containing protein [Bacteroidota bacterium]